MDALITVANLLNATGYFVKDRLWVRTLSFTAACCLTYYWLTRPGASGGVAYWSLFFAALNALFIGRLLAQRLNARAHEGDAQ